MSTPPPPRWLIALALLGLCRLSTPPPPPPPPPRREPAEPDPSSPWAHPVAGEGVGDGA